MSKRVREILFPPGLEEYRVDFSVENARALRVLLSGGLLLSVLIFFCEYVLHLEFGLNPRSLEYMLFFLIAAGVYFPYRNELFENGTRSIYVFAVLLFGWSLLLMVGEEAEYPSFLCLLMTLAVPLLIRDAWGRVMLLTVAYSLCYAVLSAVCHAPEVFRNDLSWLLLCAASSLFLSFRGIHERVSFMVSSATAETKAEHDVLTGIYNRRGGEQMIRMYTGAGMPGAFLMIDVDDFKHVNDTYGHARGDEVLKAVAAHLQSAFRETDVVMRMGGDEFIVYAVNMADIHHVENKLMALRESIHEIVLNEEIKDHVTVSIGCIINLGSYPTYEALSAAADKLLYKVKTGGKDAFLCSDADYHG